MKKLLNFFIGIALFANYTHAQAPAYAFSATSGTYTQITGTSIAYLYNGAANSDDGFATIPIGFTFNYNGTNYTNLVVQANGWAGFGTGAIPNNTDTWTNNLLGLTAGRPIVAPLWDDMDNTGGGTVYSVSGSASNRVLTVQWTNQKWRYDAAAGVISYQLKLYETTNVIEFIYRPEAGIIPAATDGASIGISATAVGLNTFISLTDVSANPGISYTTETTNILAKPASGQTYTFSPYCSTSTNNNAGTEVIGRVQFGTIDNTSTSTAQYENFTNLSTFAQPGSTMPITISGVNTYNLDTMLVWIDFNHNGLFTDAGELVFAKRSATSTYTGTVTIPAGTTLGLTRMRVKLDDAGNGGSNVTSCGLSAWGQVEDYSVNIQNCSPVAVSVQPPLNTFICLGGNATITLTAVGSGITHQWQLSTNGGTTWTNLVNAAPYSGVLTNTLTITGGTAAMNNNQYRVAFTGSCTPANTNSNASTLIVNTAASITTQPVVALSACQGTNATLSVVVAGSNPTYQWEVSTNGGLTYSNVAGATSSTLTLTNVANSLNGNRYRVRTTVTSCGTVTSTASILTVNPLPSVTLALTGNNPARLFPGLTTSLTATASPAAPTNTFKWYRDGVQIPGATTGVLNNITVDQQGLYTATVTNSLGCTSLLSAPFFIGDSTSYLLFISPTPNTGQFKVRVFSTINNLLTRTINIYDMKGTRVFTKYFSLSTPYQSMDIDMSNHMSGSYVVEVGDSNGRRLKVGVVTIIK